MDGTSPKDRDSNPTATADPGESRRRSYQKDTDEFVCFGAPEDPSSGPGDEVGQEEVTQQTDRWTERGTEEQENSRGGADPAEDGTFGGTHRTLQSEWGVKEQGSDESWCGGTIPLTQLVPATGEDWPPKFRRTPIGITQNTEKQNRSQI